MQVIWSPPSPTFWNLLPSPLNLIKSIIYLSFLIILSNRNKYCMLNHFIHSHTQTIYWEIQYCSATCNSLEETSMHQTPNDYFNNTIVILLNKKNFSKPNFTVCNAFALRVKYEIITTRGILVHDVFYFYLQ